MRHLPTVVIVCALAACGREVERTPKEVVREVVTRAVRHQSAMLTIIEQHQHVPDEVVSLLDAYVRDNSAEIDRLAQQRPLLEKEQVTFAEVWKVEAATLFDRRQHLEKVAPELMRRAEVARALSKFDPL